MKRISFFIPHHGCPQACTFCNQHSISGVGQAPTPQEVQQTLEEILPSYTGNYAELQIAFFGGSFTAIPKAMRLPLLDVAAAYTARYGLGGIRFSTRPDAVSPAILEELSAFPIQGVELGLQSMDDEVLAANRRGHTAADTIEAVKLVQAAGIPLTLQMMLGLYRDSSASTRKTAAQIVALCPEEVRIYPVLVLEHTHLATLYRAGEYQPLPLEESIVLSAECMELFTEHGIRVIRVGLQQEDSLAGQVVAGPYHPAFGELSAGMALYQRACRLAGEKRSFRLLVAPQDLSKFTGHERFVLTYGQKRGREILPKVDPTLQKGSIRVES